MGFKNYNILTGLKYNEDKKTGAKAICPKLVEKMFKSTPRSLSSWMMKTTVPTTSELQSCKVLLIKWLAIDKNGSICNPSVDTTNMNFGLYLKECNAKIVTGYIRGEKVDFIKKKDNAPNVPQCRPMQRFWALIKKQCTQKKWTPKKFEKFRYVMEKIIIEIDETSGKALMRGPRQSHLSIDLEANEDALNNLKTRVQPEFILQSRTDLRKSRQMSNMPFIIYGGCSPYNGFAQAGLQTRASQPFNPLQLATFFANLPPQLQNLIRLLAVSAPTLLQYAGR
ncbi:hypothetical protein Fcan01_16635 [Folsomia candida]|uniref:Uncharacterized protein n=1 Tax=Folsomia candida TaxID=158441 RepID=A0A226DU81_FOLCA|nr:hypothetical protein Fcan01_16635 [Folsomia candida]